MFCCNCSSKLSEIIRTPEEKQAFPFTYNYICNSCGTLTAIEKQRFLKDGKVLETESYLSHSYIPKLFG